MHFSMSLNAGDLALELLVDIACDPNILCPSSPGPFKSHITSRKLCQQHPEVQREAFQGRALQMSTVLLDGTAA